MRRAAVRTLLLGLAAISAGEVYGQTGNVAFSGNLRTRFYAWDWFEPASGGSLYAYSGSTLRAGFSQSHDGWNWNAEFEMPLLLGLPSNALGTGPQQGALGFGANYFVANGGSQNAAMLFPKQVYVRFNSLAGNKAHKLQIGRFEFLDGSEVVPANPTQAALRRDRVNARLLGNFGFTDVTRSLDGVSYTYSRKADTVSVVAAIPTRGVFQVDGWGWNRIAFGYGSYTHETSRGRHASDSRVFTIEYEDWRHIVKSDNRPAAVRQTDLQNVRIDTFGGHTVHTFETGAGTVDFMFWGAVQTGRWGVQAHRAGAVDAEAGIQPSLLRRLQPWLRGGYYWGSGDGDPRDSTHGTFFQILPTPRPFARFPFFNMMNNEDAFGILILRPHAKLTASTEFHSLRLSDASDLWYIGGGAFQPWTFGYTGRAASGRKSLANLYDASADYRVNARLTLSAYFGYAQGLAAARAIYPNGKDSRLGYLEALVRF